MSHLQGPRHLLTTRVDRHPPRTRAFSHLRYTWRISGTTSFHVSGAPEDTLGSCLRYNQGLPGSTFTFQHILYWKPVVSRTCAFSHLNLFLGVSRDHHAFILIFGTPEEIPEPRLFTSFNPLRDSRAHSFSFSEPVLVDLLRSPEIDSQPIWPICRTGPLGYTSWRDRFLRIASWAP